MPCEINDYLKEKSKAYLSRAGYSEGVGHHHLVCAETQRQAEDWDSLMVEKGKAQVCPDGGRLAWGGWRCAN